MTNKSFHMNISTSIKIKLAFNQIAKLLNIDNLELQSLYRQDLISFHNGLNQQKKLLSKHKFLKEIYVTCWYTTETMGNMCSSKATWHTDN